MNVAQEAKVGSILIVEDESVSLMLLQRLFEDVHLLAAAGTASEAIKLLETKDFDVGVFDLRVPFESDDVPSTEQALAVLRVARNRQPNMSIFTISSVLVDDDLRSSLQELGVIKNFEKPFAFPKLQDEVDRHLPR